MRETVTAMRAECGRLSQTLASLRDDDLTRPTRCAPWDVRLLLAHLHVALSRLDGMQAVEPGRRPDPDPLAYYRAAGAEDPQRDRVRQRAVADRAAAFPDPPALVQDLARVAERAVALAATQPPDRVVLVHWGPCLRLDDYLRTRVVEVAVHGLDLADALARPSWLSAAAARCVREVLVGLLGTAPPDELRWIDEDLIRAGTGRRALDERERWLLGPLAERFPLLR